MIRETRQLLAALAAMNEQIPHVSLGIMDGSLSAERQVEFAELLIELGQAMRAHARAERAEVIDGQTDGAEDNDEPE